MKELRDLILSGPSKTMCNFWNFNEALESLKKFCLKSSNSLKKQIKIAMFSLRIISMSEWLRRLKLKILISNTFCINSINSLKLK